MSFHLVHVLQHGSSLSLERGCLVCRFADESKKYIPLTDILAVIIAARGISFSSDCLSRLVKNKAVVLHCDEAYRPIGKTVALSSVIHSGIFEQQIAKQGAFSGMLWEKLLRSKSLNQALLLDSLKLDHKIHEYLSLVKLDEGNIARHYWSKYFSAFKVKAPKIREHQDAINPVNQMLNYSYAVISALVHRSIVAHGLNPSLGIHHRFRFKSDPLVYDLIEPLRPLCDYLLLQFHLQNPKRDIKDWIKFVAQSLVNVKLKVSEDKSAKLLYALDRYVSSIADAFLTGKEVNLFVPLLENFKFEKDDL